MRVPSLLLAVAVFAVTEAAAGQELEPVPGLTGLSLDLDTEEGHASNWSIDTCEVNAIRVGITMYRLGSHERWGPVTTLRLDSGTEQVVLQFLAETRNQPLRARVRLLRGPLSKRPGLYRQLRSISGWTLKSGGIVSAPWRSGLDQRSG